MDTDDLLSFLKEREKPRKSSQNPADYDRAVKVEDAELCVMILALQAKGKELRRAHDEMDRIYHESQALKYRLFTALRDAYPDVGALDDTGWRIWKGDYWYVADGDHDEKEGQ